MIIVLPGLGDLVDVDRDPQCRPKPMEPDPLKLSASKSVMRVFVIIVANVGIDIRSGSCFFFMILTRALKPFWILFHIIVSHLSKQCCGSKMLIPDPNFFLSLSQGQKDFRIRIKELKYFNTKIVFELSEI